MSEQYIPPRLAEIVEDFGFIDGREKLEYLLEFAEQLPPLPDWLAEKADDMQPIHECMTPVFLHGQPETDGEFDADGKMVFYFNAPAESPTVRGFASIMMEGVNGVATPEQIAQIPDTFYLETGLQKVLTGQRMHGMSTFLRYMKMVSAEYTS